MDKKSALNGKLVVSSGLHFKEKKTSYQLELAFHVFVEMSFIKISFKIIDRTVNKRDKYERHWSGSLYMKIYIDIRDASVTFYDIITLDPWIFIKI